MARVSAESIPAAPPQPAQITICGALNTTTIAALVELAMHAGAGLMVQPRAIAPPTGDVVEAAPRRKALPPAKRQRRVKRVKAERTAPVRGVVAPAAALDDRVRRALKDGPLPVSEFLQVTRMNKFEARRLVASGALVATGVTRGRRYALPGHPAKEAP